MTEPLVSVKMITYNHAPYISKAIECVLAQKTTFPFELVIGEDCSTDGTREIVLGYAVRYPDVIRLITSDRNVGMRANGKRTNRACRGKYIAYCEGDDYWHRSDKLQAQVDYLEAHPECGLVHSDHDRCYIGWDVVIKDFFRTTGNLPPDDFDIFKGWGGYHILTCTVMARNSLVQGILSDPGIYGSEKSGATDIPLFIEIAMASEIGFIGESLATYNVHDTSAANSPQLDIKGRFYISNLESYLYLASKYNRQDEQVRLQRLWSRAVLWQACIERNGQRAKELVTARKMFSLGDWILFSGSQTWLGQTAMKAFYSTRFRGRRWIRRRQLRRLSCRV